MKYSEGNIVLLNDGRSAYIITVNKTEKKYQVTITDNNDGEVIEISDDDITMKLI